MTGVIRCVVPTEQEAHDEGEDEYDKHRHRDQRHVAALIAGRSCLFLPGVAGAGPLSAGGGWRGLTRGGFSNGATKLLLRSPAVLAPARKGPRRLRCCRGGQSAPATGIGRGAQRLRQRGQSCSARTKSCTDRKRSFFFLAIARSIAVAT